MGIITVNITVNNIGTDTGPFDLYDNNQKLIATNITKADLASGLTIDIKDTVTEISIYSKGICNNSLNVPVTTFPLSPTPSPTPTVSATNTPTPTVTVSRTPTLSPSATPSITISPSVTPSISITPSITISPSITPSLSVSISITPSNTVSPSVTPSNTVSPSVTPSVTPSISISNTPSLTPSVTPSVTPSISISNTPSLTPSISISATPSMTPSISISQTPSMTPSISISQTPSLTPSITISPSVTPSVTPVVNIIYWEFTRFVTGTSFTVYKNGSPVVSTTSNSSGQFNYTPGDSISVQTTENVKTSDWTQTCAFVYGGALIASDKAQDETTSVGFTASSGAYIVTGQEAPLEMAACQGSVPPPSSEA